MEFHDLNAQYAALKDKIDTQIAAVISGSQFIFGPQVKELEQRLAAYVGRKHCVSCANGTDALILMLKAWNIGPGDAVFSPDFTFFASAGCASNVGATPVPVDIDPRTFNLCPDALEAAIDRVLHEGKLRPRVIIAVDLFGQPADYARIDQIAREHNLLVLEDAAQGFGGRIGDKLAGSFGHAAATSFFPVKPLGCYGDGGAIFTDNDEEAGLLRSLRSQGRSPHDKYDNRLIGLNSRLDTLQAAILLPKLDALEQYELDALNRIANQYTRLLQGVVNTPYVPEGYTSSWAQYCILLNNSTDRARLQIHLKEQGIPTMIYYPRGIHQQAAYADMGFDDALYPNTIAATERILALPMHPYLSDGDARRVCGAVHEFFQYIHAEYQGEQVVIAFDG